MALRGNSASSGQGFGSYPGQRGPLLPETGAEEGPSSAPQRPPALSPLLLAERCLSCVRQEGLFPELNVGYLL